MKKTIFPKEFLNNSVFVHEFKHGKKSQAIYIVLLCSLVIILALLPVVRVDVYSGASGLIRTEAEPVSLQSFHSGKVVFSGLKEYQKVAPGDTLLTLENPEEATQKQLLQQKIQEVTGFLNDLKALLGMQTAKPNLRTSRFRAEFIWYQKGHDDLHIQLKKAQSDFERNQILYKKMIIARVAMENAAFAYEMAQNKLEIFQRQNQSRWASEHAEQKARLLELQNRQQRLTETRSNYLLTAPVSGTLLQTAGLRPGGVVVAGQTLGLISPDSELLVECYVSPADIGMIKVGQSVKFQIDAFHYNQWGWATGTVRHMGSDLEWVQGRPVFVVQCGLNEKALYLNNGTSGKLTNGMTLNARFFLNHRTVWELLFDKMDDWLGPGQYRQKP